MLHPIQARHIDSTNKEIGRRACLSCRCSRKTLVQSDPLEMEPGPHLDRRAVTCPMPQPRPWMPTLCWLASRQVAASVVRFIVLATEVTRGRRCQLWTASVSSTSNLLPTVRPTLALRTASGRSTDGGISWSLLNLGIGLNDQVFDVALDPSNPLTVWAGIADASGAQPVNVMRSTDSGATWSNRTPPLAAPISCRGIAVDPSNSNTVIAVFGGDFGGGQVWTTTDGGDSWIDRSAGLPGNPLNAVVYDGTRLLVGGGLLFGSQFVGLYESPDLGVTWTPLHDGTWPILVVEDIAVDPSDAARIFVAIDGGGVNRTTDGGATWQIGIGGTRRWLGDPSLSARELARAVPRHQFARSLSFHKRRRHLCPVLGRNFRTRPLLD